MKTRFNHILLFALFSLFLLAGNVNAEGTERKHASSLEMIDEPALQLKAWMVDGKYWGTSSFYNTQFEETLNVEEWMINDSFFTMGTSNNKAESEPELEVKSWMVDANFWDLE